MVPGRNYGLKNAPLYLSSIGNEKVNKDKDSNFIWAILLFKTSCLRKQRKWDLKKKKRIFTFKYWAKDVVVLYDKIREIEVFGNVKDRRHWSLTNVKDWWHWSLGNVKDWRHWNLWM